MRKIIGFLLCFVLIFGAQSLVFAQDTQVSGVTAAGYIVIDAQTGQILVQKNAQQTYYPASITKIMTMALALEKSGGNFDESIIVSKTATQIPRGSSHVALLEGEQITLKDALYATLLHSANDGANVLAEYTAGSLEAFVALMNQKAAAIGCTGTQFANAHGYHDDAHYVTAEDMSKITRWAYSVPGFEELFKQWTYKMPANNKQPERLFGTDNLMLVDSKYFYEGTIGGKSGFTNEARYTMVEVVQKEGRRLISVVLGSSGRYERFSDSTALMDYCFENFRTVVLDPSAFEVKEAAVYGGSDKAIGKVKVNVPAVTVQLPVGISQSDLQVEYNIPEKYIIGQPFNAVCSIYLRSQGSDFGTPVATVRMETGSLGEILARNTGAYATNDDLILGKGGTSLWAIILGGVLLCAMALVFGRIAYVAFFKAQRRRRKMEIMRSMYYDANVGRTISAQQARERTVQRKNAYAQSARPQRPKYQDSPNGSMSRSAGTVQSRNLKVVIGGVQEPRRKSK